MTLWTTTDKGVDKFGFRFQEVSFDDLVVKTMLSRNAPPDAEFLPVSVTQDSQEVWSFRRDHKSRGFRGLALLREVDGELVIILATKHGLYEVLPVLDLPQMQVVGGELVGGRKLKELVALKQLIAEAESLHPVWSRRETAMQEVLQAEARRERDIVRQAEAAEAEVERQKREAGRVARRAAIQARQRIFAFTERGERRHGLPVVGNEWLSLPSGTFCIAVTSFDQETGAVGDVIESFRVEQIRQKKTRVSVTAVTAAKPGDKKTGLGGEVAVTFKLALINGAFEEVLLVVNMDSVRTLRDRGLNSGTYVVCPKAGDAGRFMAFSLAEGKINPVTEILASEII